MKTNEHARKVLRVRRWSVLVAGLLLISVEFWMVCSLGHRCQQMTSEPAMPVPDMSSLFAAR
jgi:hypothetical protein